MEILRLWFGLSAPVSRRVYLISGLALMAAKVGLDNALAVAATGRPWPPLAYLLPFAVLKTQAMPPTANTALAVMAVLTLPFLWIGVSMSIRRAADAGISPWAGLLFLVPFVNYVAMLVLAALPSKPRPTPWVPVVLGPFRTAGPRGAALGGDGPPASDAGPIPASLRSTLIGVLAPVAIGLGMIGFSVQAVELYGSALFFATPFVMGLTASITYNRRHVRPLGPTLGVALLGVVLTGAATMLFALEGLLCLLMAAPIAMVLSAFGALVGWALATQDRGSVAPLMLALAALPVLTGAEAKVAAPTLREVTTSIVVDAPPDAVWPHVVGFSDLPAPPEWFFRLGIAYPMRATIDGEGVGAVRRCEFSTGPFVEPITAWEPPQRLAFDVTSQPPSMTELSPYRRIDAPHLEGYMISRRGEFRLVPLDGGRTRLEGSTWYTLSIYPEAYWVVWGEALLHAIHGRVLEHIRDETQRGVQRGAQRGAQRGR